MLSTANSSERTFFVKIVNNNENRNKNENKYGSEGS
jgi:hypothetical protein